MVKNVKIIVLVICCVAAALVFAPTGTLAWGPWGPTTNTRVVILKAAGGPPLWPDAPNREGGGVSSALVVGDDVYLIDVGDGALLKYRQAGLGPDGMSTGLENLKAIFITHIHDDHWIDLPTFISLGLSNGLDNRTPESLPIPIIGPGNPHTDPWPPRCPENFPNLINPANPEPGIEETVNELFSSLRGYLNFAMLSGCHAVPQDIWDPQDIELPPFPPGGPQPSPGPDLINLCPPMDPFEIYQDENVLVTATLNLHMWPPSYALRFDTADGSVVFSGDTGPNTFGNLQKLGAGADVLVHEVYHPELLSETLDGAPVPFPPFFHTTVYDVGDIATELGVSVLVLNHIMPATARKWEIKAPVAEDFSGRIVVGRDLIEVDMNGRVRNLRRWW